MDIQQPISDDQELAKVLAGINQQTSDVPELTTLESEIETTPVETPEEPTLDIPAPAVVDEVSITPPVTVDSSLDSIKQSALVELRPLVDKLDVTPQEKFDTYLLLLRSTDDQSLISPAFESARVIDDEAKRAQALLDIIKEIDYLSTPRPTAA